MSYFGIGSLQDFNSPAASAENSANQFPAVADNTVQVVAARTGQTFGSPIEEGLHGHISMGLIMMGIAGAVVFYIFTRNVQGGG